MKIFVRFLLIAVVVIAGSLSASAQDGGTFGGGSSQTGSTPSSKGGYYEYNLGSGLKIPVNLWGFIAAPGRYVVPSSTNLVQLISFGGGPLPDARLSDVKIIRDISVDSTIVEKIIVINLELFQKTADQNQNPILYPGDTIVVPGSALNAFQLYFGIVRDVLLVVSSIISLAFYFRSK